MKIAVTYEKKDLLRLVEKDLKAQGIKVKNGTTLEYKGALEVKLSVETEDDVIRAPEPAPTASHAAVTTETSPIIENDDQDMTSVLASSNRLVRNEAGLTRTLGPNESLEFPKGG